MVMIKGKNTDHVEAIIEVLKKKNLISDAEIEVEKTKLRGKEIEDRSKSNK